MMGGPLRSPVAHTAAKEFHGVNGGTGGEGVGGRGGGGCHGWILWGNGTSVLLWQRCGGGFGGCPKSLLMISGNDIEDKGFKGDFARATGGFREWDDRNGNGDG